MADDDEDDRLLAQTAFEEIGVACELIFAQDGSEVIHMLCDNKEARQLPDLILLDLNMPNVNGWQVLEKIRQIEELKHLPIIIFTTSNAVEHAKQSYKLGANSYVKKPSSYPELIKVAREIYNYWSITATLPCEKVVDIY
jgi:CheY-like chemotaxis protein